MIDKGVLKDILIDYKRDFSARWEKEKFKWEAVKHFQDNWDIDADDFGEMFEEAMSKVDTPLIKTWTNYSKIPITRFAKKFDVKTTRKMFIDLYDEKKKTGERIEKFKHIADDLFEKWWHNPDWDNHPQWWKDYEKPDEIITYLWLKYPNKYYTYKYSRYNSVSKILKSNYKIRTGNSPENVIIGFQLYDEICKELQSDIELINLLKSHLTDNEYPDPKLKTLTIDFGNYIYETTKGHSEPTNKVTDNKVDEKIKTYTETNFLKEVYMTKDQLDTLTSLLENKKNIILQGAPGVGKTFTAKRLAYAIIGEKNNDFIEFIQFHQNYSYEDFIMGYKPTGDGFELKDGVFYRFCKHATTQPDRKFFFIIDEINRGNISKIFGELLMLIENDYRDQEITLAYNDEKFSIPENLHIIGMMNTADRSLAMIDYALRRRFSFFDMKPAFDSNGFTKYQKGLNNIKLNNLIERIKKLNIEIEKDPSLGESFAVGHSYFCGLEILSDDKKEQRLKEIIDYDIIPMLKEYWFDDKNKVDSWKEDLKKALNNG